MNKSMRPKLTPMVMFYSLFDVLGMVIFATGGVWFKTGAPLFVPNVPTNAVEAILAIVGGIALMLWATAQVLREMLKPLDSEKQP